MELSDQTRLIQLASELGQRLQAVGKTLATAESCTGGWVAKMITDVAGSSAWFDRGFVSYSNEAKQDMLGVKRELISQYGAVSEAVAEAMAQGALQHSRADLSLAITGIAGPGGGTPDKPVGLVWFAWAGRDGWQRCESQVFQGDRHQVREQAVGHAMVGVLQHIGG